MLKVNNLWQCIIALRWHSPYVSLRSFSCVDTPCTNADPDRPRGASSRRCRFG